MKYIVHISRPAMEIIETFCEHSPDDHAERAEKIGIDNDDIVSAGFLYLEQGEIVCSGFSRSLTEKLGREIGSRGEKDAKVFMFHNRTALKMRR